MKDFKMKTHLLIFLTLIAFSLNVTYPYYCLDSDRTGPCTREYIGVCGHLYARYCMSAHCPGYTSATACTACKNRKVEYVTIGVC
jgi:hypothetical protein